MAKRGSKPGQKNIDNSVGKEGDADLVRDFRSAIWGAAGKVGNDKAAEEARAAGADVIPSDMVWKYNNILAFKDFCESPDHMGFPPLSERQLAVADYMFGDDPKRLFHNNRNLAVMLWGKGTLTENSEIISSCGKRMTMKECAEINLPIRLWSRNPDTGRVVQVLSTPAIKKPEKENCFKVKTSFGHISDASEDHKYFTVSGWKKLKDIQVGDWILGGKPLRPDNIYDEPERLCRWVGYVIGDGCTSDGHQIQFFASTPKPDIISDYVSIVEGFGATARVLPHNTPVSRVIKFRFKSKKRGENKLLAHARRLGIYGKTAKDKRIPVEIMFSSEAPRRSFLEALYATDGWISRHAKNSSTWEIGYIAKNRKLIEDLDFMLRGFGIVGKIRPKYANYKGERREYWQLIICHRGEQRKFSSLFKIPGKSAAQTAMDADLSVATSEHGFSCPGELTVMSAGAVATIPGRIGANLRGRAKSGQNYSYETVSSVPGMDSLANDEVVWEQVVSIDPLGMQDVYTFTVPGTENYLQGSLFHHNSGKDTISVLMICYVIYVLLCMKNPQNFLGLPDHDAIDLYNIAACVTSDTLIKVAGGWKSVGDIINGDRVATWDGQLQPVGKLFKFNGKPVYSLMLENGLRMRCTGNHRFKVLDSGRWIEKTLDDLSVGDTLWYGHGLGFGEHRYVSKIDYKKRTSAKPVVGESMEISPDIAYMLGLLVSDGFLAKPSNTAGRYVGWVAAEHQPEISAEIERINRDVFGGRICTSVRMPGKRKTGFKTKERLYTYRLSSRDFYDHAVAMGMHWSAKKGHKGFPWRVLSGDRETAVQLLAGLFDGDGSVSRELKYYSVSDETIGWVAMALNNLGISTNVWYGNNIFHLTIASSDVEKFLSIIPLRRSVDVSKIDIRHGPSKSRHISGAMEMVMSDCGISRPSYRGQDKFLVETLPAPAPGTMTEAMLLNRSYSSPIMSICPDGVEDVYDYEALPDKEMIANGILSIDSKEQAQTVFFQNMRSRVMHWPWLRGQWDIQMSGRFFSATQREEIDNSDNRVTITSDAIIFPMNIRAFSGSSEADSLEGKNLLMFVLDEVDAFKQDSIGRSAEKIYRTLRTSAVSRFGMKFKGFMLSYPRSSNGFIMKMYESTKKFLNIYGDIAFTWQVKPRELFSAQTFEFEGLQIPMDFYEEFRLDPIGAKRAYLCRAPAAETPYMEDWDGIEAAVPRDKKPVFEFRDVIENGLFKKTITKTPFMADRSVMYVLLADLGQIKDSASLTLMHRELDKIIVDFATAWKPDKKKGIKVDLVNFEDIVLQIRDYVTVDGFYADQWQSRLLVAKMRQLGVKSDIVTLTFEDYKTFKTLLYSGNIELIRHERLLDEIKNLQLYNGRKVDHAPGAHNDLAVTIVMGTQVLTKLGKNAMSSNMAAEGEYVGDNMNQAVDSFGPERGSIEDGGLMIDGIQIT